jgi:hypothetical protein
LDEIGCLRVLVQGAGLVFLNPDADQLPRDVVPLGQSMQRLTSKELLGNLTLELNAMGTLLSHGLHPSKA